jgi:AraC family transcriptional regulator
MEVGSPAWEKLLILIMALASRLLASGPGWRVRDVVCTSGPHDRPFEERHDGVCIAAVTGGTFRYRSSLGSAVLAPGALLLGNDCHCFECSHEHGVGDRCLSFRLAPEFLENVVGSVPGARRLFLSVPRLPPHARLLPVIAAAEAAGEDGDIEALEELALRLAGAVSGALSENKVRAPAPGARDERRISAALRHIEARVDESLSIAQLARLAAMSLYHFLRTFRTLVGMTPHQFILHTRMKRAAVSLRRTSENVSAIAFAAGFGDLSTFNRRFQRIFGSSPSAYRAESQRR